MSAVESLTSTPLGENVIYRSQRRLMQFLQGLFTKWPRFQWSSIPEERKIYILQAPVATQNSQLDKASILVTYSAVKPVVGDGSPEGMTTTITGKRLSRFSAYLPANIACIAPNEIEANTLAYYILRGLTAYKALLLQNSPIGDIALTTTLHLAIPLGDKVPYASADWYGAVVNSLLRIDADAEFMADDVQGTVEAIEHAMADTDG